MSEWNLSSQVGWGLLWCIPPWKYPAETEKKNIIMQMEGSYNIGVKNMEATEAPWSKGPSMTHSPLDSAIWAWVSVCARV